MTELSDKQFQLFMSEKTFADSQIGGFFELHVKVLTFLGAAIILLGWLFSGREKPIGPGEKAIIAVALVVIGCSVLLQGIMMYGSSLAYLEYKITTLNRQFQRDLALPELPFTSYWNWWSSCTHPPVTLAASTLFAMHVVVNSVLLCYAWQQRFAISHFELAVCGAAFYLLMTCIGEGLIFRAQYRLMRNADALEREARHERRKTREDSTEGSAA